MSRSKPHRESSDVKAEERAAMVALAEVLRDIFLQQRLETTTLNTKFDDFTDSTLTGRGKLLLQ